MFENNQKVVISRWKLLTLPTDWKLQKYSTWLLSKKVNTTNVSIIINTLFLQTHAHKTLLTNRFKNEILHITSNPTTTTFLTFDQKHFLTTYFRKSKTKLYQNVLEVEMCKQLGNQSSRTWGCRLGVKGGVAGCSGVSWDPLTPAVDGWRLTDGFHGTLLQLLSIGVK